MNRTSNRFLWFLILFVSLLMCISIANAEVPKAIFPFVGDITISQSADGYDKAGYSPAIDEVFYPSHYILGSEISYSLDLVDSAGGRTLWAFAPFDAYVFKVYNSIILQSKDKVQLSNGDMDYVFMAFCHDNSSEHYSPYLFGEIKAGQSFFLEGNEGLQVVGDEGIHIHFDFGVGSLLKDSKNPSLGLKDKSQLFTETKGFKILRNTNDPFDYLFFDPSIALASSDRIMVDNMNAKVKSNSLSNSHWLNMWVNLESRDASGQVTNTFDQNSNLRLEGELRGTESFSTDTKRLIEVGCLLSNDRAKIEDATNNSKTGRNLWNVTRFDLTDCHISFQSNEDFGIQSLKTGTTYYYKFYAKLPGQNATVTYSEIMSFNTNESPVDVNYTAEWTSIEVYNSSTFNASLSAQLEVTKNAFFSVTHSIPSVAYCFVSPDETVVRQATVSKHGTAAYQYTRKITSSGGVSKTRIYSVEFADLRMFSTDTQANLYPKAGQKYYYKWIAVIDDIEYQSNIGSFTLDGSSPQSGSCPVIWDGTPEAFKLRVNSATDAYNALYGTSFSYPKLEVGTYWNGKPVTTFVSPQGMVDFFLVHNGDGYIEFGEDCSLNFYGGELSDGSYAKHPEFPYCYIIASCFADGETSKERLENLIYGLNVDALADKTYFEWDLEQSSDFAVGWWRNCPEYRGERYVIIDSPTSAPFILRIGSVE